MYERIYFKNKKVKLLLLTKTKKIIGYKGINPNNMVTNLIGCLWGEGL